MVVTAADGAERTLQRRVGSAAQHEPASARCRPACRGRPAPLEAAGTPRRWTARAADTVLSTQACEPEVNAPSCERAHQPSRGAMQPATHTVAAGRDCRRAPAGSWQVRLVLRVACVMPRRCSASATLHHSSSRSCSCRASGPQASGAEGHAAAGPCSDGGGTDVHASAARPYRRPSTAECTHAAAALDLPSTGPQQNDEKPRPYGEQVPSYVDPASAGRRRGSAGMLQCTTAALQRYGNVIRELKI
jgi:hypothetical protein